jgi:hypothetical protein
MEDWSGGEAMLMLRILMSKNGVAFFLSSFAGWVVGQALPQPWGPFAGMLLTYHLFLGAMVFLGEDEPSRPFGIPMTILLHLACLALLLGLLTTMVALMLKLTHAYPLAGLGVMVYYSAFGFVLRFGGTCALSYFERDWLFRGGKKQPEGVVKSKKQLAEEAADPNPILAATGADHEEWLRERAQQRDMSRLRMSPQEDFERWLRERAKARRKAALQEVGAD